MANEEKTKEEMTEEMNQALEKVRSWLDELELKYFTSETGKEIMLPYKIEERTFNIRIVISNQWIQVFCQIMAANEVPKKLAQTIHFNLLLGNYILNEVTYSVDPKGNIYAENDMPLDTDLVNFKSELGAVVFGYQYFYEQMAPKIGGEVEEMKETKLGIT
jgi:hypothetical protein